jgi:hypothetical protein
MEWFVAHVGGIFVAIIVVAALAAVARELLWRSRWDRWPIVEGTIDLDTVRIEPRDGGEGGRSYFVLFRYSFRTLTEPNVYTGKFERSFERESEAEDYVLYLASMKLEVVFNPDDPWKSRARTPEYDRKYVSVVK